MKDPGIVRVLLILVILIQGLSGQSYYGMKYAEPVLNIDARDPIYGRRALDQIRMGEFIFSRLWRWNATLNLEPDLVTALPKLSIDGRGLDCELKPNLRWSNGDPLTSEDVVFTLNVYKINGNAYQRRVAQSVKCEVIDSKRFTLRPTDQQNPSFADDAKKWLADIQILPKKYLGNTPQLSPQADYVHLPMGSGPFKFDSKTLIDGARKEVVMLRNSYSQEKPEKFPIMEVRAVTEPNFNSLYQELLTQNEDSYVDKVGKIDLMIQQVSNRRTLQMLQNQTHLRRERYASNSWYGIAINTRKMHLQSKDFRVQLDRCIDDLAIIRDQYRDAANSITGPFNRSYGIYDESLQDRAGGPVDIINSFKQQDYKYDREKKTLYWVNKETGEQTPVTFRMIINKDAVATNSREDFAVNEIIQNFKKVGIAVVKDPLNREPFTRRMRDTKSWDLAFVRHTFSWDNNISPIFLNPDLNITGYSNELLNNDLELFIRSKNPAQRMAAGLRIHKICYDEVPYLFLWHVESEMYYRDIITDISITPMYFFTSVGRWKISPR